MTDRVVVTKVVNKVVVSAPGPQGASSGSGVTDGNKGDITVSGTGSSWQINAGAVGASELAAGAVTLAKVQQIASGSLLGNASGVTGSPSALTVQTPLVLNTSTNRLEITNVASDTIQMQAGTGLTGGGTLEANRTFAVDFATSGSATAGKAVEATDSRLSNARTPTTHKTSHATGGSDAIAPADIGAAAASHTHAAGDVTSGTFDVARIPTGTTSTTVSLGNHKHSGGDITTGLVPLARGGTNTDLSATGGSKQFLKQLTAGGTISVATIAASDLPTHTHAVGDLTQGAATTGQVIKWNGTAWAPADDATGGGGIADGDKGDITVSASGATWTIDAAAVTYAKIQNVSATDRILGRSTAGAGSVEEITCTAAGRALLDDVDAAAQRTTLGAAATSHTHAVGDLTAGSATSGQLLTYNGSAWTPVSVEIPTKAFTTGTNNDTTPDLYETVRYTTTTTSITVPAGSTYMLVVGAGGGGGGGGASFKIDGTASRQGGGGGQGGQGWLNVLKLADIGSPSTIQVTIGAGGTGGNGATSGATNSAGTAGAAGGNSILETSGGLTIARFPGGSGGAQSSTGNAAGGATGAMIGLSAGIGGRGGHSTNNPWAGGNSPFGGGGGGGGAGSTTTGSFTNEGDGGSSAVFDGFALDTNENPNGAQAPRAQGTNGNAGSGGNGLFGGGGGSGGSGRNAGGGVPTSNGGDGGAGGAGGGGGGGGGPLANTTSTGYRSGNGGAGGDGFVTLRFW